jgi:hypothetical protein
MITAGTERVKSPNTHFHDGKLDRLELSTFTVTIVCPLDAGAIEGWSDVIMTGS